MLTKKKKLSKKEIKEDKLVSSYYKVYGFLQEYRSKVFLYVGVAAVVIIAVLFYLDSKEKNNEKAGLELSRIMELYDSGAYLEAIEGRAGTNIIGLKKIVDEYGSTENGEIAKIYLANAYFSLEKFDEALKYYEDYDGSSLLFKATSLAGEAACYEIRNENEKAAELYLKASKISAEDALNADYMLNAGINFLKTGRKEQAKKLFDSIKKDYNTSAAFKEVDRYFAQAD